MDLLNIDFDSHIGDNLEDDEEVVREFFETILEAVMNNTGDKGETYSIGVNNKNASMSFGAA